MNTVLETVSEEDRQRAEDLDHRIRSLVQWMGHNFISLGELMVEMETSRGWILLVDGDAVFHTYEQWVQSLPQSRAMAFAAKRVVKELGPVVPRHILLEIDRNKLELLRELHKMAPRKVTPQVLEAAIKDDYRTFATRVRKDTPIEPRRRVVLNCELSQAEKIEEILDWAAWELTASGEPVMGRQEALEMVLVDWQQDRQQKKGDA